VREGDHGRRDTLLSDDMMTQDDAREPTRAGTGSAGVVRTYLRFFEGLVSAVDVEAVCAVVDCLRTARDRGQTVFIAGNGGSAATASHLANDLGKATKRSGRAAFRVLSLADNVSWLTALANDEGYERVFTGQLENMALRDDVLLVISASGSSPNLVSAVDYAQAHGLTTIGLLGFDGGVLRSRVDRLLWVETEPGAYGPVETMHTLLCDLVSTCLIEDLE
jgi:D-sedoheptulose 7-phosphate isomerase